MSIVYLCSRIRGIVPDTCVSIRGRGGDGAARDRHAGETRDGPRVRRSDLWRGSLTGPPTWPAPCTPSASRPTVPGRSPPWCPTVFEFFETAAAACRAEARFLPVNWHLKTDELAWILEDSGAQVLVAHHALREYVEAALRHAPGCRALIVGEDYDDADRQCRRRRQRGLPVAGVHLLHIGHHRPPQGGRARRFTPDAMGTGATRAGQLWGFREDDVYLLAGPAYHAGPGGYAFATLFTGATIMILPRWDARVAPPGRRRRRHVTMRFLTPAHFIRILEVPEAERASTTSRASGSSSTARAPCPSRSNTGSSTRCPPPRSGSCTGPARAAPTRHRPSRVARPAGQRRSAVARSRDAHRRRGRPPVATAVSSVIYIRPPGGAHVPLPPRRDEDRASVARRCVHRR